MPETMTIDDFLAALKEKRCKWWTTAPVGALRTLRGSKVPLSPLQVVFRGSLVRLTTEEHWRVLSAEDNAPGHDPELRTRLLHACGLTSQPAIPPDER